jgi:CheY-like chemotaxis protein
MSEKILIVDDDLETLRLVGLMLQRQGYDIVAANNGSQALNQVSKEKPDLIILDVMMPDIDGYPEFTQQSCHSIYSNFNVYCKKSGGR